MFLGLIILAPIMGELWRLPLFGFDLLPSDILIPVFIVVWGLSKIKTDPKIHVGKIGKMISMFIFITILSYLLNTLRFDVKEMIIAGVYLGRFLMYVVLALITHDLLKRDKTSKTQNIILGSMVASMLLIAIFGFIQLTIFPSFLFLGMHLQGWDPHIGRLLSTWFDPNFVGGFLAYMIGLFVAITIYFRHTRQHKLMMLVGTATLIAIAALWMTYSRSAYLALIATLGILALLKSRKMLIVVILIGVLGFSLSPRIQERTTDAWDSGKAILGFDSEKPLDPTAKLRIKSWNNAVEIIKDYPMIGAGYGRYRNEIVNRGLGMSRDHASGGSDSSLLTIWAMTGVFGLLTYLGIYFMAIIENIRLILKKRTLQSYINAGIIAGLMGLLVHSTFVNSLPFPLIMVYLWVGVGMLDKK